MAQNDNDKRKLFTSTNCTISETINALGFGSYQILLSFCLGIVLLSCAVEVFLFIMLPPLLNCYWGESDGESGKYSTSILVVTIMMKCVAPVWGYISDYFGRKPALIISVLLQLLLIIVIINTQGKSLVLIFKLIYSCCLSALPIIYVLLAEYCPSTSRGQSIMFLQIYWFGGEILTILISWTFIKDVDGWKGIAMIGIPLLSVFGVMCYWIPESLLFLSKSEKEQKVGSQIKDVARLNGTNGVLNQIQITNVLTTDGTLKDPCLEFFRLILSPETCYTCLIIWSLWFLNGIAYYGIIFSGLAILRGLDSCYTKTNDDINIFADELESCHVLVTSGYEHVIVNTVAEFPAILIGAIMIDVLGRKRTFITCTGTFSACLIPLIIRHCEINQTWTSILLFITRGAAMIWFTTNIVFTLENYSTKVRCTGLGTGYCFMQLGAILAVSIRKYVMAYSLSLSIFVYFAIGSFGLIFGIYLPSDTATKDLGHIGEVIAERVEAISIEYIPSKSIEIRRKRIERKKS